MSHKASHWLADIPAKDLGASAFRVLFHLCDAHNSKRDPETACFPSQAQLRQVTGMSNGGLNNALNSIEKAGLMRRRRRRNPDGTQGSTYYILGCDVDIEACPSPDNGDGTVSISEPSPSPDLAPHRLHAGGEEPVREPVKEPTPQPPKGGGDRFQSVWDSWPTSQRPENRSATETIFGRLSERDQDLAAKYANQFIAMMVKRGESPLMIPYLKNHLFADLDGATIRDGHFVCYPGSDEWSAWEDSVRVSHGERGVKYMAESGRWLTTTRWPKAKLEKSA